MTPPVHTQPPNSAPNAAHPPTMVAVVCPRCRGPLALDRDPIVCAECAETYDRAEGFLDLIVGDRFPDALATDALEYEERHCCHTTRRYWAPLFQRLLRTSPTPPRVLALGCGVGVEVDILCETGFDCIGIDNGNRVARWRERTEKSRLILANGMHLPFEDASFDAVFCGCVFPHVGVVGDTFRTTPTFAEDRANLAIEMGRILRPGGRIFAASPNRLFPLDIFHGRESGSLRPRLNPPTDPFLLSVSDYRTLFRASGCPDTRPLPPRGYWMFDRSQHSLKGRLATLPVRALFAASSIPGATMLHGSPIAPWIVVSARKSP